MAQDHLSDDFRAGAPVDLARFAQFRTWRGTQKQDLQWTDVPAEAGGVRPMTHDGDGPWHLGVEWDDPRDVRSVAVRFAGDTPPGVKVQYWRRNWPTTAPQRRPGARRGWIGRDDPWHGEWTTVRADVQCDGDACVFVFDPLDITEMYGRDSVQQLIEAEHYLPRFRRTLKVRVIAEGEVAPVISDFARLRSRCVARGGRGCAYRYGVARSRRSDGRRGAGCHAAG